MIDTRSCEQCGGQFVRRREHARFCSARCRVAWNRAKMTNPDLQASALAWSIGAMTDTTQRLLRARATDKRRAFALIGESVWWVTIVDATLVRHHPDSYDAVAARMPPPERALVEQTLAGLRFVRNRMGQDFDHADFIDQDAAARHGRITEWTWKSVPVPALESLPARSQEWELQRYHDYQARLAGHTVGETFGRAAAFLRQASAGLA